MVVLPLIISGKAMGAFALYASEIDFFQIDEMKLLSELAGDIAYAIDHIDRLERLNYLAYYDVLTGLANRTLFLERVTQYLRSAAAADTSLPCSCSIWSDSRTSTTASAGRPATRCCVKWRNGFTQDAGDANLVARLDADQFAVVLPQVEQEGDGAQLLEKSIDDLHGTSVPPERRRLPGRGQGRHSGISG